MTRNDRILGGLYGLLVGDALGTPYQFSEAKDIPALDLIEMTPPSSFKNVRHDIIPNGTWSDDGSQALCLLDSLLECKTFDIDNFASN